MNCPKCGLPKFFGIGGYAGPQCLCDVTCGPARTIGEVHERMKLDDPLYQEGFQAGAASRDAEIAELVAALETVIANAPEPYCAITRAVDAQCRAVIAKVRKPCAKN